MSKDDRSETHTLMGLVILASFSLISQAGAQTEPQSITADPQVAGIEAKYERLIEQDRARKILSTRTAHDKKFNERTHTDIGTREFINGMNEVYSFEEIEAGLSQLLGKRNPATGRNYGFDEKALNLKEVVSGQNDRMTWREEVIVIWFQSRYGIDEHGDVGPTTWAKLREVQKEKELARIKATLQIVREAPPPKVEVPEAAPPAPKEEEAVEVAKIPPPAEVLPPPTPPSVAPVQPLLPLSKIELVAEGVKTLQTIATNHSILIAQLTARISEPGYTPTREELSRLRHFLNDEDQLLKELKAHAYRAQVYQKAISYDDQVRLQSVIAGAEQDIKVRELAITAGYQILIRAEERQRKASAGP